MRLVGQEIVRKLATEGINSDMKTLSFISNDGKELLYLLLQSISELDGLTSHDDTI
jgi:hypothetical protein